MKLLNTSANNITDLLKDQLICGIILSLKVTVMNSLYVQSSYNDNTGTWVLQQELTVYTLTY